jgi:hypothetical protein
VLNRFVGGMAIVRVRSRRKEHGRTNGSSVLYTHTYCVRSTLSQANARLVSYQCHYDSPLPCHMIQHDTRSGLLSSH